MLLPRQLLQRKPDTHKGDYGKILVLAGSRGYTGAAFLASQAAICSGAGLVTLGIPESLNAIMEVKLTEVITKPLAETKEQSLSLAALTEIKKLIELCDVVLMGPGLSQNKETQELIREIYLITEKPLVLDADGINAFKDKSSFKKNRVKNSLRILTPHPGELSRLMGCSSNEINKNRNKVAEEFALQTGTVLVLKGNKTVVSNGKDVYINASGNPGMATAGSGDVLAGMVAAFLGLGISAFDSAKSAVYLHGLAGDLAQDNKTQTGLIASDLISYLPQAFKRCKIV